jgi:hypothetical protein
MQGFFLINHSITNFFLLLVTKSKCAIIHVKYFLLADPGGRVV